MALLVSLNSDTFHFEDLFFKALVPAVFVDVYDQLLLVIEDFVNPLLILVSLMADPFFGRLLLPLLALKLVRIVVIDLLGESSVKDPIVSASSGFEMPVFEQFVLLLQL